VKHQDIYKVIIIDDCSTDGKVSEALRQLKEMASPVLRVVKNDENIGYLKTVNNGMRMSRNDIILLNSDTIVTDSWAAKMRAGAYSRDNIATVTPFTNNGGACSIPDFYVANPLPDGVTVDDLARCVERCSFRRYPEIVTAVGFCMYVRRNVIDDLGVFDESISKLGYGEEDEFSIRAKRKGYVNVLCDDTFVFHKGNASFGTARDELMEINHKALSMYYPELWPAIAHFKSSNPLKELQENVRRQLAQLNSRGKQGSASEPRAS